MNQKQLPVVKGPSEMKKDPTVMATAAANLKNQNLTNRTKKLTIRLLLKTFADVIIQVH